MSQIEVLSDVESSLMVARDAVMETKAILGRLKQTHPQAFHRLLPGFLEIAGRQTMLEGTVRGAIKESSDLGFIPLVTLGVLGVTSALTALLGSQVVAAKEQRRVTDCIETRLAAGVPLSEAERVCNPKTAAPGRPLLGINIPPLGFIAAAALGFLWIFGWPKARK